jgi:hypothetical protein
LEELHCANNCLSYLPKLNTYLSKLTCANNQLTSLPYLNPYLSKLSCANNQLTFLPQLNKKLKEIYCNNNQLTYLPQLNSKIKILNINNNPVCEILNIDNDKRLSLLKVKIQILIDFRYLYYTLKFKKQFRYWLWEKIREPKIREKYHPRYLTENLHEDTDLDEVLNNW